MENTSFEEKFSIFFNQFSNDKEIDLLFKFLELILVQYKANPSKVCEFFKKYRLLNEKKASTINDSSEPKISKQNIKKEPIENVQYSEFHSSSDENENKENKMNSKRSKVDFITKKRDIKSESIEFISEDVRPINITNNSDSDTVTMSESMQVIKKNINHETLDLVVKEEWLNLYYKTIDSDENCHFVLIDLDALKYFQESAKYKCNQLTRVIMSLLVNIAEVKTLRKFFFKKDIIQMLHQNLINSTDSISYRALKLLVFLMAEGSVAWQINNCRLSDRLKINVDIGNLIDKWKTNKVKMLYTGRQLNNILELLSDFENPICQKWSCWILSQAHFKADESQKEFCLTNLKLIAENLKIEKQIRDFAQLALNRVQN